MSEVERFIQALLNNIDGFSKDLTEVLTVGDLHDLLLVTQKDLETFDVMREYDKAAKAYDQKKGE